MSLLKNKAEMEITEKVFIDNSIYDCKNRYGRKKKCG